MHSGISAVQVRTATAADVPRISALIRGLSAPFFISPSGEGAEPFLQAIGESAVLGYVTAENFNYLVAESQGHLLGVVALRDNSHLYHLFVATEFQGQGHAKQLWQLIKSRAADAGNAGRFTVNSSLNAVPVYQRFGFVPVGPVVSKSGVAFQPMVLVENGA